MQGNSRLITSSQTGVHPDLETVVRRHLEKPFRKPFLNYNLQALEEALQAWARWNPEAPLVLDSCCGVGWSTIHLARRHPAHFVLGVDCSEDRLNRQKCEPGEIPLNCAWVRADLVDFWRLLAEAGVKAEFHYLLYPNPWPKPGHLQRRWHGHPVFPDMLALGGRLECRSNWQTYIEEMAVALEIAGCGHGAWGPFEAGSQPMTPFERKYQESGHSLWQLVADLRQETGEYR